MWEGWLNTITIENVSDPSFIRIQPLQSTYERNLWGNRFSEADTIMHTANRWYLESQVPAEKWHIQTEDGETPDTLSEDVL